MTMMVACGLCYAVISPTASYGQCYYVYVFCYAMYVYVFKYIVCQNCKNFAQILILCFSKLEENLAKLKIKFFAKI